MGIEKNEKSEEEQDVDHQKGLEHLAILKKLAKGEKDDPEVQTAMKNAEQEILDDAAQEARLPSYSQDTRNSIESEESEEKTETEQERIEGLIKKISDQIKDSVTHSHDDISELKIRFNELKDRLKKLKEEQ